MMTTKTKSTIIIVSTLLIGVVVGLLLGGAIRSRKKADFERMPRRERFHRSMERIIQPTPEQKKAIDATLQKRYGQIAELREKYEDEVYAIFDSMKVEMDAILTAEQKERLEKRLAEAPERAIERRVARLAEDLQLSDEQKARISEILTEALPDMPRYDRGMPSPKSRESRKAFSRQMREVNEKIESVLTAEQREKFSRYERRIFRRGGPRHDMPPKGPMPPPPPHDIEIDSLQ